MPPLELLIYEAERTIVRGEPGMYEITSEHTFHRFGPIPNEDFRWADGLFRAKVRGGEDPSYRVRVPAGELFEKEVGPGIVRTFLRIPEKKALDGVEVLFALQFGDYGFEQLPLAGGKVVVVEARAEKLSKADLATAAIATPPPTITRAEFLTELTTPEVPLERRRKGRTVGEYFDHYQRLERPVTHSGRHAQASLFGAEPEPVLVAGRLPDGTLPGQTSFLGRVGVAE